MRNSNNVLPIRSSNHLSRNLNHRKGRVSGPSRLKRPRPLIAVYGSAAAKPRSDLYALGADMGRLLGEAGFDVMTGGYQGVMEAVSRGARVAGAHVVGITMARFEDRVNPYVLEEIHTANFYERFGWLVDRAEGYVAMPGGIGTLAEVSFAWQEILLGIVPKRPLILVGEEWRAMHDSWVANFVRTPNLFVPLTLAPTPADAIRRLNAFFSRSDGPSAHVAR
jgi:uncharacterized protein (TIGR00730 family)